jgi:hypothetical protein
MPRQFGIIANIIITIIAKMSKGAFFSVCAPAKKRWGCLLFILFFSSASQSTCHCRSTPFKHVTYDPLELAP